MCNKRLVLLGVTIFILGSGWMYPAPDHLLPQQSDLSHPLIDTERLANANAIHATLLNGDPQTYLFSELFLATSIGGSNGARLNPKALNFIQDYVKENWEELQLVRTTGGPSFAVISSPSRRTRAPRAVGRQPSVATSQPALNPSSINVPICAISSCVGGVLRSTVL